MDVLLRRVALFTSRTLNFLTPKSLYLFSFSFYYCLVRDIISMSLGWPVTWWFIANGDNAVFRTCFLNLDMVSEAPKGAITFFCTPRLWNWAESKCNQGKHVGTLSFKTSCLPLQSDFIVQTDCAMLSSCLIHLICWDLSVVLALGKNTNQHLTWEFFYIMYLER